MFSEKEKKEQLPDNNIIYEIEFKKDRKEFYLNPDGLTIKPMDNVIVQADRGEHLGRVSRIGPRSMFPQAKELKNILRFATYTDMEIQVDNARKEDDAFKVCQKKIADHGLKMKLVDVELQFDGNKICFFFTADKRIDFRALVRDLASEYRTRIELRQIGVRDEARRLGGIGVCGRSLCCKTFLTQFEPITSQMARDQNLSLSPSKISGLCGRLMCCLAFEEDFYKFQIDTLPRINAILQKDGKKYFVTKVDIFNNAFVVRDESNNDSKFNIDDFASFKVIGVLEKPEDKRAEQKQEREKNQQKDKPVPETKKEIDTVVLKSVVMAPEEDTIDTLVSESPEIIDALIIEEGYLSGSGDESEYIPVEILNLEDNLVVEEYDIESSEIEIIETEEEVSDEKPDTELNDPKPDGNSDEELSKTGE